MQVKTQPEILLCHLKRFKCTDSMEMKKLCYRVCFAEQLRLPNLIEGVEPRLYELFAIGNGFYFNLFNCLTFN